MAGNSQVVSRETQLGKAVDVLWASNSFVGSETPKHIMLLKSNIFHQTFSSFDGLSYYLYLIKNQWSLNKKWKKEVKSRGFWGLQQSHEDLSSSEFFSLLLIVCKSTQTLFCQNESLLIQDIVFWNDEEAASQQCSEKVRINYIIQNYPDINSSACISMK